MADTREHIDALIKVLTDLEREEDCRALLSDLCTMKELENMAERLHAVKLLMEGKTYAQVMEQVEISSATLSRVSRCVQYGTGYCKILKEK